MLIYILETKQKDTRLSGLACRENSKLFYCALKDWLACICVRFIELVRVRRKSNDIKIIMGIFQSKCKESELPDVSCDKIVCLFFYVTDQIDVLNSTGKFDENQNVCF